jgi:alpha-amylase
MIVNTTTGKVDNSTRAANDNAQVNQGTTFTIPAVNGMTVEIKEANVNFSTTTIAGSTEYTGSGTKSISYTYTGSDATIDIVIGENNQYLKTIVVTYPAQAVPATITSAGWATLYTPYALDFSGTGLTAYTATVSENTVTLNPVENVPANTGVVLKGNQGNYSIPVIASSSTEKGSLIGSAIDATACPAASGTYYILTKVGDKAQFNPATSGSIAAGKAFLHVGGSARTLSVVFADETTGVSDATRLKNNEESIKNGEVYNLAGQRVSQPTKGLYIVNGMKVSVK